MIAHRFVVPLFGVLLASCAVGPDYQRPAVDLPGQFAGLPAGNADAASLAKQNWREVFTDPALQKLIDEALTAGPDARLDCCLAPFFHLINLRPPCPHRVPLPASGFLRP